MTLAIQPMTALAQAPPPGAGSAIQFSLDPKNGQSEQQQWADRYACHNWSKTQSGFDPTQPGGGVASGEYATRSANYRRAMSACLEARGYGVRFGAPAAAPSAPPAALPPAPPPPPLPQTLRVERVPAPPPGFVYHPFAAQIEGGYTVTTGATSNALHDGGNVGFGFTWYPASTLPLGFRLDGSYSRFDATYGSVVLASIANGTNVNYGHDNLYGADLDAQIDVLLTPQVKTYFFGGAGFYRMQTIFKQVGYAGGFGCYYGCFPGYFGYGYGFGYGSTVSQTTTPWLGSWNVGMGFEFALGDPAQLFVEARYLRITPVGNRGQFIPIRVGLRF